MIIHYFLKTFLGFWEILYKANTTYIGKKCNILEVMIPKIVILGNVALLYLIQLKKLTIILQYNVLINLYIFKNIVKLLKKSSH